MNQRMNQRMNQLLCVGLTVCLLAGTLSGCGGEYAGVTQEDAVSGGAVSGGAVSGSAVSGSAIGEKDTDAKAVSGPAIGKKKNRGSHPYCSDTNLYYETEYKMMQARLDGTHKICLLEEREDMSYWVYYVDEDWLYYEVWDEDKDKDTLYRAPIRKDAAGYDVVSISDAEKFFTEEIMFPADYMDSHYFFYTRDNEDEDTELVKYDLQKRREVSTQTVSDDFVEVFQVKNRYIAATEDGEMFVQDLDETQWTLVDNWQYEVFVDDDSEIGWYVAQGEQALFYPQSLKEVAWDGFDIKRYDGENISDFVTWEQIDQTVAAAEGTDKLDVCQLDRMFYQGGRLYIQVQAGWKEKGVYHMAYVMLSKGEENASGLSYERGLTECMRSHVKSRKGKWMIDGDEEPTRVMIDHMVVNTANCIAMINEMAYLSLYDYKKEKGRLGCYDLNIGKFWWLDREDALFYQIGYDFRLMGYESVFNSENEDNGDDNYFTYFDINPTKDENYYGYFHED